MYRYTKIIPGYIFQIHLGQSFWNQSSRLVFLKERISKHSSHNSKSIRINKMRRESLHVWNRMNCFVLYKMYLWEQVRGDLIKYREHIGKKNVYVFRMQVLFFLLELHPFPTTLAGNLLCTRQQVLDVCDFQSTPTSELRWSV